MKKTLNIGSGNRVFDEYPKNHKCVNYDERINLEKVDVVGDVKKLPFPDEHFHYVLASDIIEHFPISETKDILKEWKRVMKPKAIIELRMPNLRKICKDYVEDKITAEKASWLLYGGQDYPGNFHYVGFDYAFFKKIASDVGFAELSYTEKGNNFEMRLRKG